MKKRYLFLACIVPLAIWLIVPFAIQYPIWVFSSNIPACKAGLADDACIKMVAALGQSGDIYGLASSLFSGLALFAVAATLWADYSARRTSIKPLLVCTIDDAKELLFDDPVHTLPRSVRFAASVVVKAANDTALNTSVSFVLSVGKFSLSLEEQDVQVPLLAGQAANIEFLKRLDATSIQQLIAEVDSGKTMTLHMEASCDSMEGLSWKTHVTYKLRFKNSDIEMIRKLMHDEAVLIEAWKNGAAVALHYEVVSGSWKHESIG